MRYNDIALSELVIMLMPGILTHRGWDKFTAILQTAFTNSFFLNENVRISSKIWLKFVLEMRINNIPALIQIMAWRRPGDKPLSEHQWVGAKPLSEHQWVGAKPLSEHQWWLFYWQKHASLSLNRVNEPCGSHWIKINSTGSPHTGVWKQSWGKD